jgi:hypothetical protein
MSTTPGDDKPQGLGDRIKDYFAQSPQDNQGYQPTNDTPLVNPPHGGSIVQRDQIFNLDNPVYKQAAEKTRELERAIRDRAKKDSTIDLAEKIYIAFINSETVWLVGDSDDEIKLSDHALPFDFLAGISFKAAAAFQQKAQKFTQEQ